MAIAFDPNAVGMFKAYKGDDANAIAQLADDGSLKTGGTYSKGNIFRWMRGSATREANNATRTAFLANLGRAFGLNDGIHADANGKCTFSRDFMDRLERILGKDVFKRDDFGIDKNGCVTSGKPLTRRRITAILDKARLVGVADFSVADYRYKLAAITAAHPRDKMSESMRFEMEFLDALLDFHENELDGLIDDNFDYLLEHGPDEPKWIIRERQKDGHREQRKLESLGHVGAYVQNRLLGVPIHISENLSANGLTVGLDDIEDKAAITNYLRRVIEEHITAAIDLFLETDGKPEHADYEHAIRSGVCLEMRNGELAQFRVAKGIGIAEPTGKDALPKGRFDGVIADHDIKTPLSTCIEREIMALENAQPGHDFSWRDDYLPLCKEHLVGLKRPIPDENGNLVTRDVTADILEKLGPQVIKDLMMD